MILCRKEIFGTSKRFVTRVFGYLFFHLLLAPSVFAQTSAQITAHAPLYPPLVISVDDRLISGGLSVEIVKEAARRAGVMLNFELVPWARGYDEAQKTKGYLLFPVARTKEREALFEWIGPVNHLDYWIFRRKSGNANRIVNLEGIKESRIGVLNNDVVQQLLDRKKVLNIQPTNTLSSMIQMLLKGRVDYIASTKQSISFGLKEIGETGVLVETVFPLNFDNVGQDSWLVASRGTDELLLQKLRKALQEMKKDGTWERIFRKYE